MWQEVWFSYSHNLIKIMQICRSHALKCFPKLSVEGSVQVVKRATAFPRVRSLVESRAVHPAGVAHAAVVAFPNKVRLDHRVSREKTARMAKPGQMESQDWMASEKLNLSKQK